MGCVDQEGRPRRNSQACCGVTWAGGGALLHVPACGLCSHRGEKRELVCQRPLRGLQSRNNTCHVCSQPHGPLRKRGLATLGSTWVFGEKSVFLTQDTLRSLCRDPQGFLVHISEPEELPQDIPAPRASRSKGSDFTWHRASLPSAEGIELCVGEDLREPSRHPFHLNRWSPRSRVCQKPWASLGPHGLDHLLLFLPRAQEHRPRVALCLIPLTVHSLIPRTLALSNFRRLNLVPSRVS